MTLPQAPRLDLTDTVSQVFAPEDNARGLYIFCVLKDFDPFGAQLGENPAKRWSFYFLQIDLCWV